MTDKPPLITVGLPVFNGEKYLPLALDSLIAQDFEDFEVVISDNASTDRTESICREYAARDSRLRYFRSAENRGAAWNYNRTVELARGLYFKWAPHDDIHAPSCLSQCYEMLKDAPSSVVLAYPKTVLIDGEGTELERYEDRLDLRQTDPVDRFCHVTRYLSLCNPVLGLVKTDTLRQTGRIRAFRGADVILIAELSLLGEFREVPEFLFYRRRHDGASLLRRPSKKDVARWYGQGKSLSLALPISFKLIFEHLKLLSQTSWPLHRKVLASVRYLCVHVIRRLRVRGGRLKRQVKQKLFPRAAKNGA